MKAKRGTYWLVYFNDQEWLQVRLDAMGTAYHAATDVEAVQKTALILKDGVVPSGVLNDLGVPNWLELKAVRTEKEAPKEEILLRGRFFARLIHWEA